MLFIPILWYNFTNVRKGVNMIQSLIKAANILEYMKQDSREFTIAEISEAISIPPSTTHRILSTLIACEFVTKDNNTHLYKLGPGLISIGLAASGNISLQSEADVILRQLSDKTNEDSFMVVRSENTGVVIGKAEGSETLKIVENFGRQIPLHKGAIRKVVLAYQSEDFIDAYLKLNLEPYSTGPVDKEELRAELEQIRNNSLAISEGEYIRDTIGLGAPVFNHTGDFVASIGIVTPEYRSKDKVDDMIKYVKGAAFELSKCLGYREKND